MEDKTLVIFNNCLNRQTIKDGLSLSGMKDIDSLIQHNLSRLLKQKGIKQIELAKKINVPPSVINDLLAGRTMMGKSMMMRICEALGVEVWEFFVTDEVPIIQNEHEKEMLYLIREAEHYHVAEDVARYGKFRIAEAKKTSYTTEKSKSIKYPSHRKR